MADYYQKKWEEIHSKAIRARTPEQKAEYYRYLRNLSTILPCGSCRSHFKIYLSSNPPEDTPDPFVWSWEFHNHVNYRTGKPSMDIFTAREMYK